ncbi:hypothetical protein BH11MYX2_BH11MYX2_11730 [soil metagenome]
MAELATALSPPSRRIALGVTAALVVVGVVTSAMLLRRDDGPSCEGLDAPVQSMWSDSARTALRTRLSATDVGLPASTIDKALHGLDAYAASWTTTRQQACSDGKRGVRSSLVLDTRMQCLDRRLARMGGLLDGLASGNTGALRAANDAITQLDAPAACTDATQISARAVTPALQAELDAGEADLSRANAFVSLGQFEAAEPLVEHAVTAANHTASLPLLARALIIRGECEHRLGRGADALATYQRAAQVAAEARDQTALADALTRAFNIDAGVLGHVADAFKSRPFIELAIDSAGRPDDVRATWLHFLAIELYEHLRKLDEAATLERESLAIRRRTLPPDHVYIVDSLETLGNIEAARDHYDEAERMLKEVLAARIAARGPRDSSVSSAYGNLGLVAFGRDDLGTAIDYLQSAVDIGRADGHPNLPALYNMGLAQLDLGRWTSADATFTSYFEAAERESTGDTHQLGESATYVGATALLTGDLVRARTLLARGVEVCRNSGSGRLATALSYAARLAAQDKDPRRARALIDEALKAPSSNVPLRTLAAAEVSLAETNCAAARPALTAAYHLAVKEEYHLVVSQAVITLARCETELGDRAAAKTRLETELAWLTTSKADEVALAPVRAALAKTEAD